MRSSKLIYIFVLLNLVICLPVFAMSSQNYQIMQDSINFAGSDEGSSTNYRLEDTAGEVASGQMDSANYSMNSGYRQNDDEFPYLTFDVASADRDTKVVYTAFGANSVTLATTPNFVASDYIAVSENWGSGQKVAVGKVTGVSGNVVSVDFWSGDYATITATPVGVDDYAYKLTGNVFDMGDLAPAQVNTGISFYDISTSARNGYSVSIFSNHELRTAAGAVIAAVADNAVTADAGEYGIRTTGDDIATSTIDFAVQTTPAIIASSTIHVESRRSAIIYKASTNDTALAGHYTQTVSYIATLNF